MSKEPEQNIPQERQKRVQWLKRLSAGALLLGILAIIYLLCSLSEIEDTLDQLGQQLSELEQQNSDLRDRLDDFQDSAEAMEETEEEEILSVSENNAKDPEPQESDLRGSGQERIHKVYLTFDDGPSIYTNDILDILAEYQVKATFFVVGKEGADAEAALQRIVEEGHTLGMHSYSHKYKELYESTDSFSQDFQQIRDYIYNATGVESVYYRFPGGSSNTVSDVDMHEFIDYLDSQGVEYYDWKISSGDGTRAKLPVKTLLENSTEDIDNWETSVVLLHDSAEKPTTVEALPEIIETLLTRPDTVILPITERTRPVHHIE